MTQRILTAALACALLASSLPAAAQEAEERYDFELTPFAGYRMGGAFDSQDDDASLELEDSASFGLIFNAYHSPVTQWEVLYARQQTEADTTGFDIDESSLDVNFDYLQAGGTYQWDGDVARPYLALTVGATRATVDGDGFSDDIFPSFSVGLGLQVKPTDRLGLRLEARGIGTVIDANTDIFCKSGPEEALCAIRIDGNVMWQLETFAGVVFRF